MKLAEALAERGDCQRRIEELKKRLTLSARLQEGDAPAEDPAELLAELERLYARLLELVRSINRTNAASAYEGTQTLSDAIVERELTGKQRDALSQLAEAASTRQDRYSKSEIKFVAALPVPELRNRADRLSKRFRELDTRIQELNWKIDLI